VLGYDALRLLREYSPASALANPGVGVGDGAPVLAAGAP